VSFKGAKRVCEALHVLAVVIQTFFSWLVFFSMDFAIHNLSNCEAHHGEADGNLVHSLMSPTSPTHQCIMLL
jgi:hypothetical protein